MNIACLDLNPLPVILQDLGHNVLTLAPGAAAAPGTVLNMPALLREKDFKPDLILQGEHLGRRIFLEGLEELSCPKVFWAVDSHLNMHWHHYYARLFTAVLTPHLSLWQKLPPAWRHPLVRQMTRHGQNMPFKPHAERLHNFCLVGVINEHRPLRRNLCALLEKRWPVEIRQNLPFGEMMQLYANSRIVPNEAIAFEVNYRLMEGASCGAVVLTPDIGEDQNALFEPDKEIVLYSHAAHLLEEAERLMAEPKRAQAIGYAAWQRVQAEHLPVHRAHFILDLAAALRVGKEPEEMPPGKIPSNKIPIGRPQPITQPTALPTAHSAQETNSPPPFLNLWFSRVQARRSGTLGLSGPCPPLPDCAGLFQYPEALAFALRLFSENNLPNNSLELMEQELLSACHAADFELNLTASFAALKLQNFTLAKQFLYRQLKNSKLSFTPPGNGLELCLLWAKLLAQKNRVHQLGFLFDVNIHLPSSVLEVLLWAEHSFGQQLEANKKLLLELLQLALQALGTSKATCFLQMGYAARLCLLEPDNWRAQLDYGFLCLLCCRLEEGLFELEQAALKARAKNEEKNFTRLLRHYDISDFLQQKLLPPLSNPL